jgi:hypothetical protein
MSEYGNMQHALSLRVRVLTQTATAAALTQPASVGRQVEIVAVQYQQTSATRGMLKLIYFMLCFVLPLKQVWMHSR